MGLVLAEPPRLRAARVVAAWSLNVPAERADARAVGLWTALARTLSSNHRPPHGRT